MSTELDVVDGGELAEVLTADAAVPALANRFDDDFNSFTSGFFLPRLQLEGSSSDKVKRNKIAKGNWSLTTGRDSFVDLGQKVDILVFDYRTKAMDISDTDNVIVVYDKDDPAFKRIQQMQGQGYLFGLEFLVWVPSAPMESKFATLFMGNPTNRVAARNFKPFTSGKTLADRVATLGHEIITKGKNVWEGPTINRNTVGLDQYPSLTEMMEQRKTFLNPVAEIKAPAEKVEEAAPDNGRDR